MRALHFALASLVAVSTFLLGCEEESTTTDEGTQVEPPTMELVSPTDGQCISIGTDPNTRIPFVLKTTWLYLRPPGFCGESVQCGNLVLWVNDELTQFASTSVVEWDVASAVNRYGEFQIRIAAYTDQGKAINDAKGVPLEVKATITTAVSCPTEP